VTVTIFEGRGVGVRYETSMGSIKYLNVTSHDGETLDAWTSGASRSKKNGRPVWALGLNAVEATSLLLGFMARPTDDINKIVGVLNQCIKRIIASEPAITIKS